MKKSDFMLTKTMYWDVELAQLKNQRGEVIHDIWRYFYPTQLNNLIRSETKSKGVLSKDGRIILFVLIGGKFGYPSYPDLAAILFA